MRDAHRLYGDGIQVDPLLNGRLAEAADALQGGPGIGFNLRERYFRVAAHKYFGVFVQANVVVLKRLQKTWQQLLRRKQNNPVLLENLG